MKMIRAIVQPHRLESVRDELHKIDVVGITVFEARGYGRQRGHKEIYRGAEYQVSFRPKVVLDMVVEDEQVDAAIDAIAGACQTGHIGDGKIFVSPVEQAVRVRTGERGQAAL